MTLAIALRCADGLVMASDSRVTGGARQSADISEKFLQVNRDVGIMTYGLAVPGYRGIRALVEEVHQNPASYPTMASIVSHAQSLFQQVYQDYLNEQAQPDGTAPPDLLNQGVGYIIGGYDGNETAQFRTYSGESQMGFEFVESLGPNLVAAQWHLAEWLMPMLEFPGQSVAHGLRVAVMVMILTSAFEYTVGGPIHLATATLEQGFTLLHEREVAGLVEQVQPYLLSLKRAWLEAWNIA
jgi:20S proteasome alpha/beta subunit